MRRFDRRGQSIVEYLIIATVIVAAIIAIRSKVSTNMNSLFNNAANKTNEAATSLGSLNLE
jgi:Flp pilus assembly pilin Flp